MDYLDPRYLKVETSGAVSQIRFPTLTLVVKLEIVSDCAKGNRLVRD